MLHTVGACHCTNGGCGTGRGSGTPVLPPTVWTKRTLSPRCSGSGLSSGSDPARNVAPTAATCTRVAPISSPDRSSTLAAVIRPSCTSTRHRSRFANR